MKRVSVFLQPLVVILAVLFACFFTPVSLAESEDDDSDVETTEDGEETPPPLPECKARMEVQNPDYEFGSIKSGEIKSITHTYSFRNSGEETLIINKIKASCGCTSAIASASQVAPGATATLTMALDPKGRSGSQTITVRVNSNDPTNTMQIFRMKGTILSAWRVLPVQVEMGALGKLQSATKDVMITSQYLTDEPLFKITSIQASSPEIHAATIEAPTQKITPPNKNYVEVQRIVRVNVTAGPAEGEQSQRVFISTDDPKNPTHTVTVRWKVEGDLTHTPNKVFVSNLKGKKINRDLTLSSRAGIAFDVTSIELQGSKGNDDLEVTQKPESTPTRKVYSITSKVVSEAPSESRSGKIIFNTTNPEQPVLTVQYVAISRK